MITIRNDSFLECIGHKPRQFALIVYLYYILNCLRSLCVINFGCLKRKIVNFLEGLSTYSDICRVTSSGMYGYNL